MTDHHLDDLARAVFAQAATEGRSGELLEALWNGAGCTLDPVARRLVILPFDVLAYAFPDGPPDEGPRRTPFTAVTEGIAGSGTPPELQPTGWSRVAVPHPPGTTVAVAPVDPAGPGAPDSYQATCKVTDTGDDTTPRLEVHGRWQITAPGGYRVLVEVDHDDQLPAPPWCGALSRDLEIHLWAPDAGPEDHCLCRFKATPQPAPT